MNVVDEDVHRLPAMGSSPLCGVQIAFIAQKSLSGITTASTKTLNATLNEVAVIPDTLSTRPKRGSIEIATANGFAGPRLTTRCSISKENPSKATRLTSAKPGTSRERF